MLSKQELNLICKKLMLRKSSGDYGEYEWFKNYINKKYNLTSEEYNAVILFIEKYLNIQDLIMKCFDCEFWIDCKDCLEYENLTDKEQFDFDFGIIEECEKYKMRELN